MPLPMGEVAARRADGEGDGTLPTNSNFSRCVTAPRFLHNRSAFAFSEDVLSSAPEHIDWLSFPAAVPTPLCFDMQLL